jgi:peptidoglycan biosynthesis protein MviN/MurJ (putative lipid II flippase)
VLLTWFVTALVNGLLGLALLRTIGTVGVVYATVVAGFGRYVLLRWLLDREFGLVVRPQRALGLQLFSGAVMCASLTGVTALVPPSSWVWTVGMLLLGAAIYVATLLVVGPRHRRMLWSAYRQFISS